MKPTPLRIVSEKIISDYIQQIPVKNDSVILDLGSGNLKHTFKHGKVITFDIDPESKPDYVGDAHSLPFENNYFDFVLSSMMLEHTHTPEQVVNEIYRVLSDNGSVVLSTVFVQEIHGEPNDYYRFSEYGLKHLFRLFDEVQIIPVGNKWMSIWQISKFCFMFDFLNPIVVCNKKDRSPHGYVVYAKKKISGNHK